MPRNRSPERKDGTLRAAARITFCYFVLAIAWITLSDRLLLSLVQSPEILTRLQTYKGWIFVFSTSVLLFLLIHKVIDQLRLLDQRRLVARRRANRRLQRALLARKSARRQMEAVLANASDGIVVISWEGMILLANRQAELFFREDPADETGDSLHERILARLLPGLAPLHEKQGIATFDLKISCAGTDRILNAAATPLVSRSGESTGAVIVLRDVSHERHYDALKNRFIATAAHELKTPLTSVMGYSELLTGLPGLNPEARDYAGVIYEQALTLARIVDDLLDLSHMERGGLAMVYEESCDLAHLLQRTLEQCQAECKDRLFKLELPVQRVLTRCDSGRIAQVVENLLDNAVKFSPQGTLVRIALATEEEHHQVCVSDQGIGMSAEVLPRIFDRFYRADTSDTAPAGLGLGLSIVQGIVTAHGGRAWAESEPGRGTTVCFTLPRSGN